MTNGLNALSRVCYSDHSLAVYLAPLTEGRRVAVVGPISGDVAKRFRALGAATVVAFGGTGEGIAVRALTPGALAAFRGKVDCVVIPDASAVQLDAVLEEARRALGQDGIVAVASRSPNGPTAFESANQAAVGPGYYELHDALSERFANVQMLGRGPFVAYTIAALGEVSGDVVLDTRLVPAEASSAEAFIAVASDGPLSLDAIALVQVPTAEVLAPQPVSIANANVERISALEEEIARREAKLKEVENASAERWVKIQRFEHETKGLEEEARKARDRAAKLAKDLEDERKLRQRVEIDVQMSRRAPELPRGLDPEELSRAREKIAQLERDSQAVQSQLKGTEQRLRDLEREIDETQATEASLRAALDEAERSRDAAVAALEAEHNRRAAGEDPEFARLENDLRARAEEIIALRAQIADHDAAVRELTFTLEAVEKTDVACEAQQARERVAELSSLNSALAAEASKIVEQNDLLRERVVQLESEGLARASEAQEATWRAEELKSRLQSVSEAAVSVPPVSVRAESGESGVDSGRVAAAEASAAEAQAKLVELHKALDEERDRSSELHRQIGDARNDLARQYALNASIEDRIAQTQQEIAGMRAGYTRRVRELEREVDQLVQALEVASTQSREEQESLEAVLREAEVLKAERVGIAMRLYDAEQALMAGVERSLVAVPTDVAARLALTEENLAAARQAEARAGQRVEELTTALEGVRSELASALSSARGVSSEVMDTLRREGGERELLVRSLVAQLEDRDLRLRAMERRLIEDVERARRIESEIWEVELRARDQRLANLNREIERLRAIQSSGTASSNGDLGREVENLRTAVDVREREIGILRAALDQVRSGLSSILVDGRGAVVAHDLVSILRQIEESPPGE